MNGLLSVIDEEGGFEVISNKHVYDNYHNTKKVRK